MRRALAAAALGAAAACHPAKPPQPAPAPARAAAPDAGPPRDPAQEARDLLASARAQRERMERNRRQPDPDPAVLATDAQGCAWDAKRARERGASIEAVYLEAVCTAAWARLQGFTPLIERRVELIEAFDRTAKEAPDLDGAGPDRELGALLAALPAYAGGDLELARKHLEDAIRRAPKDARNRLVLARAVAVKAQDRSLFREQLQAVIDGSDQAAVAEASALLRRESELFAEPQ